MIINSLNNYTAPHFTGIPFRTNKGIKLFEEIHCKNALSKDCFVSIYNPDYAPRQLRISLDSDNYLNIGNSELTVQKSKKTLFNDSMMVYQDRNKHCGAGTVMHLAQIATMLENNFNKLELLSLGQSVYFHSKFKFEPAIKNIDDLEDILRLNILCHDGSGMFDNEVIAVKDWLDDNKSGLNKKLKEGNKILYDYIQRVNYNHFNLEDEFQFPKGFNMRLTKQKVLENKSFFNDLFKKFHIDYKINNSAY